MRIRKKNMFGTIRIASVFAAALMALQIFTAPVLAAPKTARVKYEKNGVVEVDFRGKVQYRNLQVSVKDSTGKAYAVRINDRDDDELEFTIRNYKAGMKYSYVISGIRAKGEKSYGKVTGVVSIPKETTAVKVKKIKYDVKDRELEIDLNKKVGWKNPSVRITDGSRTFGTRITDRDSDELEVRVSGLTRGKTYKYTITGVVDKGTGKTLTLTGSFKA